MNLISIVVWHGVSEELPKDTGGGYLFMEHNRTVHSGSFHIDEDGPYFLSDDMTVGYGIEGILRWASMVPPLDGGARVHDLRVTVNTAYEHMEVPEIHRAIDHINDLLPEASMSAGMIYTLGYAPVYEELLDEKGDAAKKLGRRLFQNYPGGSVWETREGVEAHIKAVGEKLKDYRAYGVLADWKRDTEPSADPNAPWHDLLVDAPLVRLPEEAK